MIFIGSEGSGSVFGGVFASGALTGKVFGEKGGGAAWTDAESTTGGGGGRVVTATTATLTATATAGAVNQGRQPRSRFPARMGASTKR